ncbi:MAG: NfeD family protein [Anaerolineae bacterium]
MSEWTGLGTLNCVYFFLFALGVGYALIAAVTGGLSHIDIPGIDLHPGEADIHLDIPFVHDISQDVDYPEIGLSPLSPITIATFITTFGGVGLIVNSLADLSSALGLLISTASGLALAGAMYLVYARVLMAVQASSEVEVGDLVGLTAEVIAPIPEGNVGEVVLVARGTRARSTARSADRPAIPRGTMVEIVKEVGNVVIVRTKEIRIDK